MKKEHGLHHNNQEGEALELKHTAYHTCMINTYSKDAFGPNQMTTKTYADTLDVNLYFLDTQK